MTIENLPDSIAVVIGAVIAAATAFFTSWMVDRRARISREETSLASSLPIAGAPQSEPASLLAAHNDQLERALSDPRFGEELRRNLLLEGVLELRIEEEIAALADAPDELLNQLLVRDADSETKQGLWDRFRDKCRGGAKSLGSKVLGMLNGLIKSQLGLPGD